MTDALRCLKDLGVKFLGVVAYLTEYSHQRLDTNIITSAFHTSPYFTTKCSEQLLIAFTEMVHLLIAQIQPLTVHVTTTAFRHPPTAPPTYTDNSIFTPPIVNFPEIISDIITMLCKQVKILAPAATYILIQFIRDSAGPEERGPEPRRWDDFSDSSSSRARTDREREQALQDVMSFDAAYYYTSILNNLLDAELKGAGGFGSNPCITGGEPSFCTLHLPPATLEFTL